MSDLLRRAAVALEILDRVVAAHEKICDPGDDLSHLDRVPLDVKRAADELRNVVAAERRYDGPPLEPTPGTLKMILDVATERIAKIKAEQGSDVDLVDCIALAVACNVALDEWLAVTAVDYLKTEVARRDAH